MFKKIISLMAVLSLLVIPISAEETAEKIEITSAAYVLYNPDNDEVVESHNGDQKMYPASLTKMMTALLAYEMCEDLDSEIATVSDNAISSIYGTSSSTAGLKKGEQVTIRQLLYLLMLPSGNDAANVIAEYFCGDNETFAQKMNQKAKEIGMENTHFANPHGLHDENHYTTAKDLAILADVYTDVKLLAEIAACNQFVMPATNKQGERVINTTNFMKIENSGYYYEYANGLKTGNTDEAGRCLAASAQKDGVRYICILLNCPEVWYTNRYVRSEFLEAADIFEYAFENYECIKIAQKGQKVGENQVFETYGKTAEIVLESDIYATLPKGTDLSALEIEYALENLDQNGLLLPNVTKGDILGKAIISLDGRILGETSVMAGNNVEVHFWLKFWHKIDFYIYLLLGFIAVLILLFVLLIIRKNIIVYKRKKAKQKRLARKMAVEAQREQKAHYDYFKME